MKVLAIFAAIAAVAIARPATTPWTLQMLDQAITNPNINPEVKPILVAALDTLLLNIYNGVGNQQTIDVALPAGEPVILETVEPSPAIVSQWTIPMLDQAIMNPNINPEIKPILIDALNTLMHNIYTGTGNPHSVDVALPAGVPVILETAEPSPAIVSQWTIPMLDQAIMNPNINPDIKPILIDALNTLMHNIFTGTGNPHYVDVALPADAPLFLDAVETAPVVPAPVLPAPVETPSFSGPLVQITINVDGKPQVAEVPYPEPRPEPVATEEEAVVSRPEPVETEEEAVVSRPEPEQTGQFNPIDIIAVNPIEPGVVPVEDVGPM